MRELVEEARAGSLEAFGQLVERFQDAVYGTAYALLGDFHDAQDRAQESYIRAWRNLTALQDPEKFPGWLYRITRNCCIDFLRRTGTDVVSLNRAAVPASDDLTAPEKLEKAEMREAVLREVRALSEANRLATTLFYIDGYNVREVAEFLDVPAGTVKRRLHDSRNQLKERLMAMVEDELKGSRPGREFKEQVLRQVSRVEVRPELSPDDRGLVVLVADDGRGLPICIGKNEEAAIHRAVTGQELPRPLTHELLLSVLRAYGIEVKEVRVTQLGSEEHPSIFFGELVLEREGEERIIDSRPSDAVALAMMTGAQITVSEDVLEEGPAKAVQTEEGLEDLWQSLASPEQLNQALGELCAGLQSLRNDALAQLIEEVGAETVLLALATKSETVLEEEAGRKRKQVVIAPTSRPDVREYLASELAQALQALYERLEQAGLKVGRTELPPPTHPDALIDARRAVRQALRGLSD